MDRDTPHRIVLLKLKLDNIISKNKSFIGLLRILSLFNHNRIPNKILSRYNVKDWLSLKDILLNTYLIDRRIRRYDINTSLCTRDYREIL